MPSATYVPFPHRRQINVSASECLLPYIFESSFRRSKIMIVLNVWTLADLRSSYVSEYPAQDTCGQFSFSMAQQPLVGQSLLIIEAS